MTFTAKTIFIRSPRFETTLNRLIQIRIYAYNFDVVRILNVPPM